MIAPIQNKNHQGAFAKSFCHYGQGPFFRIIFDLSAIVLFIGNHVLSCVWFNAYKVSDSRNTCIICEERIGSIQTVDGMICPYCMPRELLPQAKTLRKHKIMVYHKSYSSWESCAGLPQYRESAPIEDRSAAITHSTPTKLTDELNAQIENAESIDIVVSFIMLSGLGLLMEKLTDFTRHGRLRT